MQALQRQTIRFAFTALISCVLIFPVADITAADPITVRGTVVDDETGEPISALMIQAGKFDRETPGKITWGYSESRSSSDSGKFRTTVNWNDGWTARVVVEGYLPQAIITESPKDGKKQIDVTIRLKRGFLLSGRVLDYEDKPVADASVFPVGPTGMNVYGGHVMESWGDEIDKRAKGVKTGKDGKFELPVGDAKSVVVTSESFQAWAAKIPESKERDESKPLEIKLPEPATITIKLDIEGSEKESRIFFQMIGSYMDGFEKVETIRTLPITNGGKLELRGMTPGKYQFSRKRGIRLKEVGMQASLDHHWVELKAGEHHEINMIRKKGACATGKVTWPEDVELTGVVIKVQGLKKSRSPWSDAEFELNYDAQQVAGSSTIEVVEGNSREFKTDLLAPGEYVVIAEAYRATRPGEGFRNFFRPDYQTKAKLVVAAMGEPGPVDLKLEAAR